MTYRPYDLRTLMAELSYDEGRKRKPYQDTEGILTIGVGWNLEANGLPEDVIDLLLERAIEAAEQALDRIWPAWRLLDADRQRVLLNMAFNLGETRLRGFKKMWAALRAGDYATASREMLDSKWAAQVKARSKRLAQRMRGG